jgi:hypothetical protein
MRSSVADPQPTTHAWSRRGFLGRLATAASFLLLGRARAALASTQTDSHDSSLTESDRLIASVAGPYTARDPRAARRIARWAEAQLPASRRPRSAGASAALVRTHLLRPTRIAEELARDDVMMLDGWVLARSEAAAAIYLHALASRPDRPA